MTVQRRAFICGVGGQDGAYLARFLLVKGYEVVGTSRDAAHAQRGGPRQLGADAHVRMVSIAPSDFLQTVSRVAPDEIYNLAGQTSVGLSFNQPVETIESIVSGVLNLLEAMRFVERPIIYVDDFTEGCAIAVTQGEHLDVYNVGARDKLTIAALAQKVAVWFGREAAMVTGEAPQCETSRRCPDIANLWRLGWPLGISLYDGLARTRASYVANAYAG